MFKKKHPLRRLRKWKFSQKKKKKNQVTMRGPREFHWLREKSQGETPPPHDRDQKLGAKKLQMWALQNLSFPNEGKRHLEAIQGEDQLPVRAETEAKKVQVTEALRRPVVYMEIEQRQELQQEQRVTAVN